MWFTNTGFCTVIATEQRSYCITKRCVPVYMPMISDFPTYQAPESTNLIGLEESAIKSTPWRFANFTVIHDVALAFHKHVEVTHSVTSQQCSAQAQWQGRRKTTFSRYDSLESTCIDFLPLWCRDKSIWIQCFSFQRRKNTFYQEYNNVSLNPEQQLMLDHDRLPSSLTNRWRMLLYWKDPWLWLQ